MGEPLRIGVSWPGAVTFNIYVKRNSYVTKEAISFRMTTRNVTADSKLMTLFLILLAGLIIMNIKVISSLSLKIRTCLFLSSNTLISVVCCVIYVLFLLILASLKHYNNLAV